MTTTDMDNTPEAFRSRVATYVAKTARAAFLRAIDADDARVSA